MRFLLYIVGFLVLIGGLAWAATEAGVPQLYVMIGAVILFGLGLIGAASRPRIRDAGVTVTRDNDVL
jgi:hypothetical protein